MTSSSLSLSLLALTSYLFSFLCFFPTVSSNPLKMSHRFFFLLSFFFRLKRERVSGFPLTLVIEYNKYWSYHRQSLGRKFHVTNHHLSISCPHPPSWYVLSSSSLFPSLSSSLSPLSSSLFLLSPLLIILSILGDSLFQLMSQLLIKNVEQGLEQWRGTFYHEEKMSLPVSLLAPKRVWEPERWRQELGHWLRKWHEMSPM